MSQDKPKGTILGALRLDPIFMVYIPALILTPIYSYYMAVHYKQQKPYPGATITMTACHYPQDIVFRFFMIICTSLLSLTFYIVFRWLENQCQRVKYHHRLSKLWFYVTQFSICCFMVAVGTIDQLDTGPLHTPCAVIFFVVFLIVIIRITLYLNQIRSWDTTVLSARSLLIKNIVASYILVVWLYCLYFVLKYSNGDLEDDSFKYVVIVEWNSCLINLLWLLTFVYQWKQFNFCLTDYSKKQNGPAQILMYENIPRN